MSTNKIDKYKKAKQELIESCKETLIEAFKEFLEKHKDKIDSASFVGYTPSFNDGDPCTFGVGSIDLKDKNKDDDYSWLCVYDTEYCDDKKLCADIEKLEKLISELEDVLPSAFNNEYGFRAIFTLKDCAKNKIVVEDYDCGY